MTGFEFARFGAGVDFRLNKVFGLGPFVDFSLGSYSRYKFDVPGAASEDGDISNTASHQWLTFGVRGVFFP